MLRRTKYSCALHNGVTFKRSEYLRYGVCVPVFEQRTNFASGVFWRARENHTREAKFFS
jgi:hypothetical protein